MKGTTKLKSYVAILFMAIGLGTDIHTVNAQDATSDSEQILDFVLDKCRFKGFMSKGSGTLTRQFKIKDGRIATDEKGSPIIDTITFGNLVAEKTISGKSGITALMTVRIAGVREEENKKFDGLASLSVAITDGNKATVNSVKFIDDDRLLVILADGRQYFITCASVQRNLDEN